VQHWSGIGAQNACIWKRYLSDKHWSRRADLNREPPDYKFCGSEFAAVRTPVAIGPLRSPRRLRADVNRYELRPEVRPLAEARPLSSRTTPRGPEVGRATYLPGHLAHRSTCR
jgi:hypothetical protein